MGQFQFSATSPSSPGLVYYFGGVIERVLDSLPGRHHRRRNAAEPQLRAWPRQYRSGSPTPDSPSAWPLSVSRPIDQMFVPSSMLAYRLFDPPRRLQRRRHPGLLSRPRKDDAPRSSWSARARTSHSSSTSTATSPDSIGPAASSLPISKDIVLTVNPAGEALLSKVRGNEIVGQAVYEIGLLNRLEAWERAALATIPRDRP